MGNLIQSQDRCLYDSYGRKVSNLRISLTQKCNFNCFFCHKEGQTSQGREMTPQEIEAITESAYSLGMTKIKLTGGEPLLRPDLIEIISKIRKYSSEISLTTNGYFLKSMASPLKKAGLQRVNISLHSIQPQIFNQITGSNSLNTVKEGVTAAIQAQLNPVKINMVILKGINDSEIPQMIDYTAEIGALLQLIEFQPVHNDNWTPWSKYHQDLHKIEAKLANKALKIIVRDLHRRQQYHIPRDGGVAIVEVVRPMHNSQFCQNCHRLRITSNGKIKPCLLRNDNLVDTIPYIQDKPNKQRLIHAFKSAINQRKPYWKQ